MAELPSPTPENSYNLTNQHRVDADTFNGVFGSIDERLKILESIQEQLNNLINDVSNQASQVITTNLSSQIAEARAQLDAAIASAGNLTGHTDNFQNPHRVTKKQVELGNVDNTSDAQKAQEGPIHDLVESSIQQVETRQGIIATGLESLQNALNSLTNIAWTSSNDGVGSGLDADLLGGLSKSSFVQRSINNILTGLFEIARSASDEQMRIGRNRNGNPYMALFRGSSRRGYIQALADRIRIGVDGVSGGHLDLLTDGTSYYGGKKHLTETPVYKGSDVNNTVFPIGTTVLTNHPTNTQRNQSYQVRLSSNNAYNVNTTAGALLAGDWRQRGRFNSTSMERIS